MTEVEWLTSVEPADMLRALGGQLTERKLRLFACACCQRVWPLLTRSAVHEAIRVAERYADHQATAEELHAGWTVVRRTLHVTPLMTKWEEALMAALQTTSLQFDSRTGIAAAEAAARALDHVWRQTRGAYLTEEERIRYFRGMPEERAFQSRVLRDLFSYHKVRIDPTWKTWERGQVVSLARTIYQEERFQDMPVLADALEEAGCDVPKLLEHCRSKESHFRGCWALDALLGQD